MGLIKRKDGTTSKVTSEHRAKAAEMTEEEVLEVMTAEDANKLPGEVKTAYNDRLKELQRASREDSDVHRILSQEGQQINHRDLYPDRVAGSASTREMIAAMADKLEKMPETMAKAFADAIGPYLAKK